MNSKIAKELKITPVLDKIRGYRENWIRHVIRMPCNRLPGIGGNYRRKGKKEREKTLEETNGYVRPIRVNKWPNCMVARS